MRGDTFVPPSPRDQAFLKTIQDADTTYFDDDEDEPAPEPRGFVVPCAIALMNKDGRVECTPEYLRFVDDEVRDEAIGPVTARVLAAPGVWGPCSNVVERPNTPKPATKVRKTWFQLCRPRRFLVAVAPMLEQVALEVHQWCH